MHQGIAFRTAYLLTGSAADAEDAVQVGFVKAWGSLPRFRRGAPFRPWLLRIVANEAHNRRRSSGRVAALQLRSATVEPRDDDASASPEIAALGQERREELLAVLQRLDEDHRDVLVCRYFLELSEDETAEVLGVRRGTVKSRVSRALARVREEMSS